MNGYDIIICSCPEGPYLGARKMGTPCRCERCGFMTREQYDAIAARVAAETRESVLGEVAERINELANLAAEHLNCSGCPTPWWLTNWLQADAIRDLRGGEDRG